MQYINFKINTDIKAPFFIGSMIRGAFGVNLKDVVCINPTLNCSDCFAKENCIYYEFYEQKNSFVNYSLNYTLNPKTINFNIKLFNGAIDKYPYILSAIEKMVTKKGLGKDRVTTNNLEIYANNNLIYKNKKFNNLKITPNSLEVNKTCQVAKLKIITPIRIKRDGKYLNAKNLTIKDILISIVKKKEHYSGIKEKIQIFPTTVMQELKFLDLERFSNRQKTKMKVGGVIGEMVLSNISPQVFALLKYGEITGVGKLNSFGLGKIEINCL